ncbi:hypothetical protein [Enterobacter phage EspM4VN]|uniref:Uncharacterized protein n=1 Tax=Enterobacter phage EspM4VN TaxID=2137745 RepID=A0A4P2WVQ7_9CAUD|nr:hypothetical protein HYP11_gp133 [Enterobacter phage EspM4VN]BBK03814.1 hypothetical protein [Enterobacter phage EspM4VN]
MNAIETDFTKSEMSILESFGFGVVTLEGQIVDRGLPDNVEMGIMTNGDRDAVMKAVHAKFLAEGWNFKNSPIDGKPVNHMHHTIFLKDGFQIGFYSMDAVVESGASLVEYKDHYLSVSKSTWA